MPPFEPPSDMDIARLAAELYLQSGGRPGRDLEYWLEAEARLWLAAEQSYLAIQRRIWDEYCRAIDQELLAHAECYDERLWVRRLNPE